MAQLVLVEGLAPRTRYAYQVAVSDGREASVAPPREVTTRVRKGTVKVAGKTVLSVEFAVALVEAAG